MRIHTNLCLGMVEAAAKHAGVTLERRKLYGSKSHDHAFDIILSGTSGRRASFGAEHEAATWDEWGMFLGYLFENDPEAKCIGAGGIYKNDGDFHWQTDGRFESLIPTAQHRRHKWVPTGYGYGRQCTGCSAIQRWRH